MTGPLRDLREFGGTTSSIGAPDAPRGSGGVAFADRRELRAHRSSVDATAVDAVIGRDSGAWVPRDLTEEPGYVLRIRGGRGTVDGAPVAWDDATVMTGPRNGVVYVDPTGAVLWRSVTTPEQLAPAGELLLHRTYADPGRHGNRVYAVADSRTFYHEVPRSVLAPAGRIAECVVASGDWAGAVRVTRVGAINWYFANLGLYPLVEELPALVRAHLDVQHRAFLGTQGTGQARWAVLHGTAWSNQFKWFHDVAAPASASPIPVRADSHDATFASFLRLAVRYARVASGGLAWWDSVVADIQEGLYYNIFLRQRLVTGGYLTETFQDPAVYPFCQTLDNCEVYRGLADALALMATRGGAQASYAASNASYATNILAGIQGMWLAGDGERLSSAWDNTQNTAIPNPLQAFYPDLIVGPAAAVYDVPLSADPSVAWRRLDRAFTVLNAKAPTWYCSRKYDLFPWGILAASAAKVGYRDLAERWLGFVQRHQAYDAPGYLQVHDIGWARYVERVLAGDALS
jgi:hypothetical protein